MFTVKYLKNKEFFLLYATVCFLKLFTLLNTEYKSSIKENITLESLHKPLYILMDIQDIKRMVNN